MCVKEPVLDYDKEIQMLEEKLETSFPGLTSNLLFKAHKRFVKSKETSIWFDRVAGLNGQGGSSSPVTLSKQEVK